MFWFWRKKEKPKRMCFRIEEDLVALDAKDSYAILNIEKGISDTGKATVGSGDLDIVPTNPDVQTICVYPYPETPDVTVEEILAVFTKLGLHATLLKEDEYAGRSRRPYSLTLYIPWITWSKGKINEDE